MILFVAKKGIVRKPCAVGEGEREKLEIRPIMTVALTYDYRIIDGRTVKNTPTHTLTFYFYSFCLF